MTFLLDHCTWKETENILKDEGFSCTTLRELGKNEAANGEVIALANSRKAILVTRDRDFANLTLYPLGNHQGVIFLQITPQSIEKVHGAPRAKARGTWFPPTRKIWRNSLR